MNNPFSNIDNSRTQVPLQKKEQGVIRKKKAGRPQRPNMARYIIKMDKTLHAQLTQFANEYGINKSAVITQAVRKLINA